MRAKWIQLVANTSSCLMEAHCIRFPDETFTIVKIYNIVYFFEFICKNLYSPVPNLILSYKVLTWKRELKLGLRHSANHLCARNIDCMFQKSGSDCFCAICESSCCCSYILCRQERNVRLFSHSACCDPRHLLVRCSSRKLREPLFQLGHTRLHPFPWHAFHTLHPPTVGAYPEIVACYRHLFLAQTPMLETHTPAPVLDSSTVTYTCNAYSLN